jgi:hypothetical protein
LSDLPPEYVLLGATLKQAVRDAKQTRNERLKIEEWEFLEIRALAVAAKLPAGIDTGSAKILRRLVAQLGVL